MMNWLFISHYFFEDFSKIFYVGNDNRETFISLFLICVPSISFPFLLILASTSGMMMNKRSKKKHPSFVILPLLSIRLAVDFAQMTNLVKLRKYYLISSLLDFSPFYNDLILILSNIFSSSIEMIWSSV